MEKKKIEKEDERLEKIIILAEKIEGEFWRKFSELEKFRRLIF
ncbi:MAG: hypothetical protein M0T81_02000 [Thermoplasmatales archaeon]|nr:hypothetical protein [Thermoplasmatales archaeon]